VSTRIVLDQLAGNVLTGFPGRYGNFSVVLPVPAGRVRVQCRRSCVSDASIGHDSGRFAYNPKDNSYNNANIGNIVARIIKVNNTISYIELKNNVLTS